MPSLYLTITSPLHPPQARQRLREGLTPQIETAHHTLSLFQTQYVGHLQTNHLDLQGPYGNRTWPFKASGILSAAPEGSILHLEVQSGGEALLTVMGVLIILVESLLSIFVKLEFGLTFALVLSLGFGLMYSWLIVLFAIEVSNLKSILTEILSSE